MRITLLDVASRRQPCHIFDKIHPCQFFNIYKRMSFNVKGENKFVSENRYVLWFRLIVNRSISTDGISGRCRNE